MTGSGGQVVIVNEVVAPRDLPLLRANQTAVSGAREFREALEVATAQDKKNDSKQLDRETFRAGSASSTNAQASNITLSSTETQDSASRSSESRGTDDETLESLGSSPSEEHFSGKELPTIDRQSLPINVEFAGSGRESSNSPVANAGFASARAIVTELSSPETEPKRFLPSGGETRIGLMALTNDQLATKTMAEGTQASRTPLGINDLNSARMTRMSLDRAAMTAGPGSDRTTLLGLSASETLRGQLERTRFSQSVNGEDGRKRVDSALRLAKVEALVSELSSSAPKQIIAQSSTPSLLQSGHTIANSDLSLLAASPGSFLGQLAPKSLMPVMANSSGTVNARIDSAAWMEQIANHAKMAIKQDLRSVEIKLSPAHLGTIEILVAQDDKSTQLAFFTKHAHVRDALESQLARLQKFFQEDGLELSDAWVSDQSLAEHRERQSAAEHGDLWAGGTLADGISFLESENSPVNLRKRLDPDRQLDVWA